MPDDAAVPTQLQPGPWEQDIRAAFTDPEVAAQVDNFLRARVQPRMTQLEQQLAGTKDAQSLYDAFHEDPVGTYQAITSQLVDLGYPVGAAESIAQNAAASAASAPPAASAAASPAAAQTEDPRISEMYADYQRTRELAAYDAEIERIVNDPTNADINPNRLHIYVAAADGDFERAVELYRHDVSDVLLSYGVDPASATPQQQDQAAQIAAQQTAPPVMGGDAGGAGAPVPASPEYRGQDGLHKAIEDATAAMLRSGEAPPVS